MSRYGLRGRFGMVLQDIWLYEGAIRVPSIIFRKFADA